MHTIFSSTLILLFSIFITQKKILIVDDNVFNLLPIKLLMKDMKIDTTLIEKVINQDSGSGGM